MPAGSRILDEADGVDAIEMVPMRRYIQELEERMEGTPIPMALFLALRTLDIQIHRARWMDQICEGLEDGSARQRAEHLRDAIERVLEAVPW